MTFLIRRCIILFLFTFFHLTFTLKNLWIIRHCDKGNHNSDPCCNINGYERSKNWYNYFNLYIKNNCYIYGANYNNDDNDKCININGYQTNKNCQKSQRMFLTSLYIFYTFENIQNLNINYCIGDYKDLTKSAYKQEYDNVIIVWEHDEIIDIINYIGIDLEKWPNDIDGYNLVFMVNIDSNKLYYDCYNFEDNNIICDKKTNNWLKKYEHIDNYYSNYKNLGITYSINNKNIILFIIPIAILLFLFLFFIVAYKCMKYKLSLRQYKFKTITRENIPLLIKKENIQIYT
jgi:hypothetical protein